MKHLIIGGTAALAIGLTGCSATGGAVAQHPTPPTPRAPQPSDFSVSVLVTGKQCFMTSCVYTYNIQAVTASSYPPQMPGHNAMTVIYTVTGGDQEAIGHVSIHENGWIYTDKNVVSIGPDNAHFTATVTSVAQACPPDAVCGGAS